MRDDVRIEINSISKEFNYQTIFRDLSQSFHNPQHVAVLGENGSGKSTFLRVMAGMTVPTEGNIDWKINDGLLPDHLWFNFLSFGSPELYFDPRFTVEEVLAMYIQVKPFPENVGLEDLIGLMNFEPHRKKNMNELSSGMYQRIRLVLTICSDVPVLFLDEPCSNLDKKGVAWYNDLIEKYAERKLIFVASNDPREYDFCTESLSLMDYKCSTNKNL